MIEIKESDFLKAELDTDLYMTTENDGTVKVDEKKKEKVKSKWKSKNDREVAKWMEGLHIMWNALHFNCDESVLAGMKADKRYKQAKEDVAIIELLRILQDVVNQGAYGTRHNEVATNLKQCRSFLTLYQGKQSIAVFTARLVEYFNMQITIFGNFAFGENIMFEIIAAYKGESIRSITLRTYINGSDKERSDWADKYKNNIVARLMILNCADHTLREKTDEAIRLRNGMYPTTILEATALLTASARAKKTHENKKRNDKRNKNRYNRNNSNNRGQQSGNDSE